MGGANRSPTFVYRQNCQERLKGGQSFYSWQLVKQRLWE